MEVLVEVGVVGGADGVGSEEAGVDGVVVAAAKVDEAGGLAAFRLVAPGVFGRGQGLVGGVGVGFRGVLLEEHFDVAVEVVEGGVGLVLDVDENGGANFCCGCRPEDAVGGECSEVVEVVIDEIGAAVEGVVGVGGIADGDETIERIIGAGKILVVGRCSVWIVGEVGVLI